MAAMEVMGLLMVRPPLRPPNTDRAGAVPPPSLSATPDQIGDPAHLRLPLGAGGELEPEEEAPAPDPAKKAAPAAAKSSEKVDKSKMSIDDMIAWCREHDAK